MSWLIIAIISYFIFAVVFLIDKHLLGGAILNPKLYTFYTGILRGLVVLLIPFIEFKIDINQLILSLLTGFFFVFGLFYFFKALSLFEVSRIVPAVGGFVPVFSLILIFLFSLGKEFPSNPIILAIFLLLLGSVLIEYSGFKKNSWQSIKISLLSSFFIALYFIFSKYVYLESNSFLEGFILIAIASSVVSLFFIFSKEVNQELLKFNTKRSSFSYKMVIFIFNQLMGATASLFQSLAVFFAPLIYVPVINALQSIQYAFLFLLTILISVNFPMILKEEISKKVIFQKIFALILISLGLILFHLFNR